MKEVSGFVDVRFIVGIIVGSNFFFLCNQVASPRNLPHLLRMKLECTFISISVQHSAFDST